MQTRNVGSAKLTNHGDLRMTKTEASAIRRIFRRSISLPKNCNQLQLFGNLFLGYVMMRIHPGRRDGRSHGVTSTTDRIAAGPQ